MYSGVFFIDRAYIDPRHRAASMLAARLSEPMVSAHALARPATEELRSRAAGPAAMAYLFDLPPRRFLAQRRLVDLRQAIKVGVPLHSNSLGCDFRIHAGKLAEKCARLATIVLILRELERFAHPLGLLLVAWLQANRDTRTLMS
jgi:hypothetical protein